MVRSLNRGMNLRQFTMVYVSYSCRLNLTSSTIEHRDMIILISWASSAVICPDERALVSDSTPLVILIEWKESDSVGWGETRMKKSYFITQDIFLKLEASSAWSLSRDPGQKVHFSRKYHTSKVLFQIFCSRGCRIILPLKIRYMQMANHR